MSATNQNILDMLGTDTKLWSPSTKNESSPVELLSGKVVMFYFSAHWCGPCRRFTPMLIELYKKLKASSGDHDFEIVYCSMDRTDEEYQSYTKEMPWWCLPHKSPLLGKLANLYQARGIPHLVILERDGSIMHADGVGQVSMDPQGAEFPWRPKSIVELLSEQYLSSDKKTLLPTKDLDDKYLMLYFSAHWCPPCKRFTPKLSKAYEALKKQRNDFELLFVSSDHDQQGFDRYFGEMSFAAIPFAERKVKADLASRLGVRGIPMLVMLGPKEGDDRPVINANARSIFEEGDYLSDFPYKPKTYGNLNKSTDDINNFKCVIVFHEGGDDEEQETIQTALESVATKCEDEKMRFYWANSPSGLSQTVRNALNLGPAGDEPCMILLDVPDGGSYYVSATRDITTETIEAFLQSPGEKKSL